MKPFHALCSDQADLAVARHHERDARGVESVCLGAGTRHDGGLRLAGAVRAVQDKLNEEQLKKADSVVERFALAVVRLASRQDDGSRIVEEEAVQAAEKATCPVYPFCSE